MQQIRGQSAFEQAGFLETTATHSPLEMPEGGLLDLGLPQRQSRLGFQARPPAMELEFGGKNESPRLRFEHGRGLAV